MRQVIPREASDTDIVTIYNLKTQHFFSTSNYMAKKSRKLREMNGIMSVPQKISKGRKLYEVLMAKVAAFYESDEIIEIRNNNCCYVILYM